MNAGASDLTAGFGVARALDAPVIVLFDDAIERVDGSRRQSLDDFRATVRGLIDQPGHEGIRLAIENSFIKITRQPEDLLAIVRRVDHPRVGVNFDADNFYNAGIEPFPVCVRAAEGPHRPASRQGLDSLPAGGPRRGPARAPSGGGNVICVPLGTGAVNWEGLVARLKQDGYRGAVSLEPHTLPEEMAGVMEQDAAYLRAAGLVA